MPPYAIKLCALGFESFRLLLPRSRQSLWSFWVSRPLISSDAICESISLCGRVSA